MPALGPGGGSVAFAENPPFDVRIRTIRGIAIDENDPNVNSQTTLFRGRIETKSAVNGRMRRLNFLYNPSTITWNGSVDANTIGDSQVASALDVGSFLMPMSQTVGFSLMFDRTYETWIWGPSEASRLGVLSDIKQFYAMLGILGEGNYVGGVAQATMGVEGATADQTAKMIADDLKAVVDTSLIDNPMPTSFMQYIPVIVTFSDNQTYSGVIQTASIAYTHFTVRMIPSRCSIDISMQLFPTTRSGTPPPSANATAGTATASGGVNSTGNAQGRSGR